MRIINQRTSVVAFLLLAFAFHPGLTRDSAAQDTVDSIRQRLVVLQANQRCQPAWVKFVAFGRQPRDAVLAQATVENTSDKVITAVKLGWKVYKYPEGNRISLSYCDPQPLSGEIFEFGATPLIQLEQLAPMEKCIIGINPLPLPMPATRTVFVDRPLLTTEDVKSLPIDSPAPKLKYAVVTYLSEIHFVDGTIWKAVESSK